jgi:hypothetical protein
MKKYDQTSGHYLLRKWMQVVLLKVVQAPSPPEFHCLSVKTMETSWLRQARNTITLQLSILYQNQSMTNWQSQKQTGANHQTCRFNKQKSGA